MRSSVVLPQPDGPISTVMLSGCDFEDEIANGNELGAVGTYVRLVLDADFKPACYASALSVVQWVAPRDIRLPA